MWKHNVSDTTIALHCTWPGQKLDLSMVTLFWFSWSTLSTVPSTPCHLTNLRKTGRMMVHWAQVTGDPEAVNWYAKMRSKRKWRKKIEAENKIATNLWAMRREQIGGRGDTKRSVSEASSSITMISCFRQKEHLLRPRLSGNTASVGWMSAFTRFFLRTRNQNLSLSVLKLLINPDQLDWLSFKCPFL